ncbi:MAG: DUF5714 domain-containing protein [Candidatus Thorarchaeota archaeon SMTZ1-83]|nr:MAG: hypothetical protein AM324_08340 [Candidatus Thorarchaeota archaeon SMTZ1-83]
MAEKESPHDYACMVCGERLVYNDSSSSHSCDYCGLEFTSTIYCPQGHFVCDSCHSTEALDFLSKMAESEKSDSPRDIVETAFRHPSFKFHGPEHHSLVPAALLIAMKNRGLTRTNGEPISADLVREGIRRGAQIPGGFCGTAGNCGACVGAGIAVALYIGSTPTKGPERKSAHIATITALEMVTDGLIRCCKRSSLYGISAATRVLRDSHSVELGPEPPQKSCENWERNRDCAKSDCVFFPDGGE